MLDERHEGHLQYPDDRRRQSDISSRRDRRGKFTCCIIILPVDFISVISLTAFIYIYRHLFNGLFFQDILGKPAPERLNQPGF